MFVGLHHVAIIVSDYERSRAFYVEVLGLPVVSETYRAERQSHKLNLALPGGVELEIFSFPDPPARVSRPEACGLRHLALRVASLEPVIARLRAANVDVEPVRVDELTGKRFTFFADPDALPMELYET